MHSTVSLFSICGTQTGGMLNKEGSVFKEFVYLLYSFIINILIAYNFIFIEVLLTYNIILLSSVVFIILITKIFWNKLIEAKGHYWHHYFI